MCIFSHSVRHVAKTRIIVMVESLARSPADPPFAEWLTAWVKSLPPAPAFPLEALRRENLYDTRETYSK